MPQFLAHTARPGLKPRDRPSATNHSSGPGLVQSVHRNIFHFTLIEIKFERFPTVGHERTWRYRHFVLLPYTYPALPSSFVAHQNGTTIFSRQLVKALMVKNFPVKIELVQPNWRQDLRINCQRIIVGDYKYSVCQWQRNEIKWNLSYSRWNFQVPQKFLFNFFNRYLFYKYFVRCQWHFRVERAEFRKFASHFENDQVFHTLFLNKQTVFCSSPLKRLTDVNQSSLRHCGCGVGIYTYIYFGQCLIEAFCVQRVWLPTFQKLPKFFKISKQAKISKFLRTSKFWRLHPLYPIGFHW